MPEFLIQHSSTSFLVNTDNRVDLDLLICRRLAAKSNGREEFSPILLQLSQLHQIFNCYYDVDADELPREGIVRVTVNAISPPMESINSSVTRHVEASVSAGMYFCSIVVTTNKCNYLSNRYI